MKHLTPLLILFAAFFAFARESSVAQIREIRQASNDAILAQDAGAVAESWTDDIQVIISSGAHLDGKEAYKAAFASIFNSIPGIYFVRAPHKVSISDDGQVASEQGTWTGYYPGQAITQRSGTYLAYWRLVDGKWLISAELFVPLSQDP